MTLEVFLVEGQANSLWCYYLSDNGLRLDGDWRTGDFRFSFSVFIHLALSLSGTSLMRQYDQSSLRLHAAIKSHLIFKTGNHIFI